MSKNIQTGGVVPSVYVFGLEGDKVEFTDTIEPVITDKNLNKKIDKLAASRDRGTLEHKQKFAIMPYNASTSNLLLNLRGITKEGYGGMAAADVLFVSDERCIVIQTIYNEERILIQDGTGKNKTLEHKKWNSYNEVFYINEKVPRDYRKTDIIEAEFYESAEKAKHTQDDIKYKYKSRDSDRFMGQQFGSRELLSKKGARAVSSGGKKIVGISTCFPVDSVLKESGYSKRDIDNFWKTLNKADDDGNDDFFDNLLKFTQTKDMTDINNLNKNFKIRKDRKFKVEEIDGNNLILEGGLELKLDDKDSLNELYKNAYGDEAELWLVKNVAGEYKKLETPMWYRIEGVLDDGEEYGYIKYNKETDELIGTYDNGEEYKAGQKFSIVFLHSANGLLATPEFGTHIITGGAFTNISSIREIEKKTGFLPDTGKPVSGLIYSEWGSDSKDNIDAKLEQVYNMDISLNYGGKEFPLKPLPIVWRHTLKMKWGEGFSGNFDRNSGAYPTNVTENVEYFIKDTTQFVKEDAFIRETHVIDDEEVAIGGGTDIKYLSLEKMQEGKPIDINKDIIKTQLIKTLKEITTKVSEIPEDKPYYNNLKSIFKGDMNEDSAKQILNTLINAYENNWEGFYSTETDYIFSLDEFNNKTKVEKYLELFDDDDEEEVGEEEDNEESEEEAGEEEDEEESEEEADEEEDNEESEEEAGEEDDDSPIFPTREDALDAIKDLQTKRDNDDVNARDDDEIVREKFNDDGEDGEEEETDAPSFLDVKPELITTDKEDDVEAPNLPEPVLGDVKVPEPIPILDVEPELITDKEDDVDPPVLPKPLTSDVEVPQTKPMTPADPRWPNKIYPGPPEGTFVDTGKSMPPPMTPADPRWPNKIYPGPPEGTFVDIPGKTMPPPVPQDEYYYGKPVYVYHASQWTPDSLRKGLKFEHVVSIAHTNKRAQDITQKYFKLKNRREAWPPHGRISKLPGADIRTAVHEGDITEESDFIIYSNETLHIQELNEGPTFAYSKLVTTKNKCPGEKCKIYTNKDLNELLMGNPRGVILQKSQESRKGMVRPKYGNIPKSNFKRPSKKMTVSKPKPFKLYTEFEVVPGSASGVSVADRLASILERLPGKK